MKKIQVTDDYEFINAIGYNDSEWKQAEEDMRKYLSEHVNNNTEFDCFDFADAYWHEYEDKEGGYFYAGLIGYTPIDDETKFEIVMGMTIEGYKNTLVRHDYEVSRNYYDTRWYGNFTTDFYDITDYTEDLEDFKANANFGQKATINGVTYYKIRNKVNNEPYTIYYTDDWDFDFA